MYGRTTDEMAGDFKADKDCPLCAARAGQVHDVTCYTNMMSYNDREFMSEVGLDVVLSGACILGFTHTKLHKNCLNMDCMCKCHGDNHDDMKDELAKIRRDKELNDRLDEIIRQANNAPPFAPQISDPFYKPFTNNPLGYDSTTTHITYGGIDAFK